MAARRSIVVFIALLFVLGAAVLSIALASRDSNPAPRGPVVLVWDVPSELAESAPPAASWTFESFRPQRPTVWNVVRALDHASRDRSVEALVLHIDGIGWGWGRVAEVREALMRFRASGKRVYASLSHGGEREYLLASVAQRIAVPPLGIVQLDGLSISAMFWRGAYDKLDIHPNFEHVGAYKSGVEPYTRNELSEPSRLALEALLDDQYGLLTDSLAHARRASPARIRALIENGPYEAESAVATGLADTILHGEDLDSLATRTRGRRRGTMTFTRYLERVHGNDSGAPIALILASGDLVEGRSRSVAFGSTLLGSETLIEALRAAQRRSSVRAIVLRVDSPGGSPEAAEAVWHEIERVRRRKPVIVSMSDLAASGGYYLACGADSIVAQSTTLTGSIGVYGGKLNILGLMQKLGLNVETLSRGANAQMLSPYKDFSPEELVRYRAQLATIYRTFVSRVSTGRNMSAADVDSVAQGRVWSGSRAVELGLVDALGGFQRAFQMARARAGLEPDDELVAEVFPQSRRSFLQSVLSDAMPESEDETALRMLLPAELRDPQLLLSLTRGDIQARAPYTLEIR
ncbi:MAG: signal peptide peptidase SppA [Candidatus Eisenbacteria bacterium]|uniref:Signal peptide peptidase SppA n=1 Tax=Eiseniibacteriota bacterium TaxID=2212470 RepID=A0A849SKL3_UNCEI|nr:signal peptide peptidase SppA [Candidatus Eisenbacteria bacterium]